MLLDTKNPSRSAIMTVRSLGHEQLCSALEPRASTHQPKAQI